MPATKQKPRVSAGPLDIAPASGGSFAWNGAEIPTAKAPPDPAVRDFLLKKAMEREAASGRSGLGISPQMETIASLARDPAGTLMDAGMTALDVLLPGSEDTMISSVLPTRK